LNVFPYDCGRGDVGYLSGETLLDVKIDDAVVNYKAIAQKKRS